MSSVSCEHWLLKEARFRFGDPQKTLTIERTCPNQAPLSQIVSKLRSRLVDEYREPRVHEDQPVQFLSGRVVGRSSHDSFLCGEGGDGTDGTAHTLVLADLLPYPAPPGPNNFSVYVCKHAACMYVCMYACTA